MNIRVRSARGSPLYDYTWLINNPRLFLAAGIACLWLARFTPSMVAEVSDVKTVSASENNTFSCQKNPTFIHYAKIQAVRCSVEIIF